jgi:hypothetical protein
MALIPRRGSPCLTGFGAEALRASVTSTTRASGGPQRAEARHIDAPSGVASSPVAARSAVILSALVRGRTAVILGSWTRARHACPVPVAKGGRPACPLAFGSTRCRPGSAGTVNLNSEAHLSRIIQTQRCKVAGQGPPASCALYEILAVSAPEMSSRNRPPPGYGERAVGSPGIGRGRRERRRGGPEPRGRRYPGRRRPRVTADRRGPAVPRRRASHPRGAAIVARPAPSARGRPETKGAGALRGVGPGSPP